MVREYRGEAFERPKTWWGRLWDCTPEECYHSTVRIADVLKEPLTLGEVEER